METKMEAASVVETGGRRLEVYDLSQTLSARAGDGEAIKHEITYLLPAATAAVMEKAQGLPAASWPQGAAFNSELVNLSTHSGTHVDAPAHYGPRPDGQPARTIDQVPLRWCIGDGVLLDVRSRGAGEHIDTACLEAELARIGHELRPYDIVLLLTGCSARFGTAGYDTVHPGLTRQATEFLVDRGVRLIGTDAWGLDRPFPAMVAEAKAGDTAQLWQAHILGREKEYCQIENLAGLEALPHPTGFTVVALPWKLEGASAGWARVVAIY
jgi:kynurenine formamidase